MGKITEEPQGPFEYVCDDLLQQKQEQNMCLDIIRPIQQGRVTDWKAFQDMILYILTKKLGVVRLKNDKPVVISIPCSWTRDDCERMTQIMFEVMNAPGLLLLEQPLACIFAHGASAGLVVDIGYETVDISAVFDNQVVRHSCQTLPFGARDLMDYLAELLNSNAEFKKAYPLPIDDAFLLKLLESELIDAHPIPHQEKVASVHFEYNGYKVPIGIERFNCTQILFQPALIGKDVSGLHEAMFNVIQSSADADKRLFLWENIALTGGLSYLTGLKKRLEMETSCFLAASETSNEFQAKEIGYMKVPEYFTSFKDRLSDLSFVGASVVAKVTFFSSANYITKASF